MLERFHELDIELFALIHRGLWGTVWIEILKVLQHAGDGIGISLLLVTGVLLTPKGRRLAFFLKTLVPVVVASAVAHGLKYLVNSDRPLIMVPDLLLNDDVPKHYSWPSGHTTAAFAFATAILMLRLSKTLPPRRFTAATVLAFALALTTGLARIAVGAHFPSDVLGGALVGITVAYLTCRLMDRPKKEDQEASRH